MEKSLLFSFLFGLSALVAQAQQTPEPAPSMTETFEKMHQMMLKGMFGDTIISLQPGQSQRIQIGPDSNSFFYFRVDTSFQRGATPDLFKMNPFGSLDPDQDDFWGFNRMMREMEEMQRRMWGMPAPTEPQEPADGLLPEERIRLKEQQTPADSLKAQPKPRIKTIRI